MIVVSVEQGVLILVLMEDALRVWGGMIMNDNNKS